MQIKKILVLPFTLLFVSTAEEAHARKNQM